MISEGNSILLQMEERIEEITTTITSDDDELRDNGTLEFGCSRRVPFPEYGMDIIDREYLNFTSNVIYIFKKYAELYLKYHVFSYYIIILKDKY